ncbi:MAG: chitobiase/beta-hexosaminidase C-terminal domain-containing protein [Lachnospiraceae bacterium]|nr:chitobiase/beta-hexosaminidase C-terminal domain-containing protein [Lachnospiraceae bacterium]
MKCSKCGAEIRVGSVYCESCGEPAQIVPDYNILEDDFLVSILDEKKKEEAAGHKQNAEEARRQQSKSDKPKNIWNDMRFRIGIIVGIVLIAVGIIGTVMFQTSYGHYVNKGLALDKKEEYQKAVTYYEKAISKDGEKTKAKLLAADDYLRLEEYDKSEALYLQVIEEDSNNLSAYKGLITLYLTLGDYSSLNELQADVTNQKILKLFEDNVIVAPQFSEKGGKFSDDVNLTLVSEDGNEIYYSDDGSDPSKKGNGILYKESILLTEGTTTIKAVCKGEDGKYSQVISNKYRITYEEPEMAEVDPAGGTFTTPTMITINVPEGAKVYYTWDGTTPSESSTQYTGPFEMMEGNHILSLILVDKHGKKSDVTQCNYKYIAN